MEMIQFNDSLNFIPVVMQLFVCKLQIFLCKWQKDFCYFIKGNDMLFDVQKRLNSTTIELQRIHQKFKEILYLILYFYI